VAWPGQNLAELLLGGSDGLAVAVEQNGPARGGPLVQGEDVSAHGRRSPGGSETGISPAASQNRRGRLSSWQRFSSW